MTSRSPEPRFLLGVVFGALVLSGIAPHDRFTWVLEVAPILIVVPILVATASRFSWTPTVYRLLAIHALILMIGGHYTYAEVPAGFWVRDAFGLARNHYDRVGHFAQGFVPALVTRELLRRTSPLEPGRWLSFLSVAVALAGSACYELIEWWTAVATGEAATAFLGTQGDPWDTQWDMAMALVGAVVGIGVLGRQQDRELAALDGAAS